MALINIQNVSLRFKTQPVFDEINFQIQEGEKICLLGRNGAGKSTMMKLINGDVDCDSGEVLRQKGLRTSALVQDVPVDVFGRCDELIYKAISVFYHDDELDSHKHIADRVMTEMSINPSSLFENLSAGLKRRVLLARALASEPDILLLDEPTNHLDLDSVLFLEDFLCRYKKTVFFVTHDRTFLQKIANRIVELDRGKLYDWKCDYRTFLIRKDEWLESEQARNKVFDKKLEQEEAWIRKGIKARRTRNEGRVRALHRLREERSERREVQGGIKMQIQKSESSGKMIIESENLNFSWDKDLIVKDFSTRIMRGDKIGIIGPNGCGKSTLIKLLLGELNPVSGTVRTGTRIECVYYDQLRGSIDSEKTVRENAMNGNDYVDINGSRKHVIGYLSEFLFPVDMADMKAGVLSGGEKNRLMLAKLFTNPFNVLVMDEPTNDLDIETIELLEELLLDFEGTLLLVSHDRSFLDNIASTVYSFEGDGVIKEYAGGYEDWERSIKKSNRQKNRNSERTGNAFNNFGGKQNKTKTKLSKKESDELAAIPLQIEKKEQRKNEIFLTLSDPAFYQNRAAEAALLKTETDEIDSALEKLMIRWEELDAQERELSAK